jgi:hypothetical protein
MKLHAATLRPECQLDVLRVILQIAGAVSRSNLIGGTMAETPNPNKKLVKVFDTEQETEALVVRGLLDSAGIDCDVTSLDAAQDILPGVGGNVILVREEDAVKARNLIQEYRRMPSDESASEADLSGATEAGVADQNE